MLENIFVGVSDVFVWVSGKKDPSHLRKFLWAESGGTRCKPTLESTPNKFIQFLDSNTIFSIMIIVIFIML